LRYLSLLATADNGAHQGIFRFHDRATGPKGPRSLARIVVKPLQNVTVSVVDGRGAPVEGASVVVLDVAYPVSAGRTDVRGIVKLSAPSDVMTHWIFGYKPGVGFDYFENYVILPSSWSPLPERAELALNGTRTVRVRAVDSNNNPVSGTEIVPVSVFKKGKLSSVSVTSVKVRTDSQGVATFDWLPADIQPRTNFFIATRSYAGPIWPGSNPNATSDELTLRLLRVTPISGEVTRPDGSPAAGILVNAEDFLPVMRFGPGPTRTAADGSYTIDVAPGRSYTVYITDDDWAARAQTAVDIREGEPRTAVDFRLEKGSVIRGRVTAGGPTLPAPELSVTLIDEELVAAQPLRGGYFRTSETDKDGRYAFRVRPGNYSLSGPDEFGVTRNVEQLKVGDGQDIERDFRVSSVSLARRPLRGVIRSSQPGGPPIARAIVIGAPLEVRDAISHTFADGDGRFELPRPFGRALIYTRDGTGNLGGFTVVSGEGDSDVTIVARPAAIARGRVVDGSGTPYGNARVAYSVSTERENAHAIAGAGSSLLTDDLGRFTVPGLFVGARCKLYAIHPTGGGSSPTKSFHVKDTQPIDLGDVVLRPR
jgi:Carboxypeptidase regulatory-like domain